MLSTLRVVAVGALAVLALSSTSVAQPFDAPVLKFECAQYPTTSFSFLRPSTTNATHCTSASNALNALAEDCDPDFSVTFDACSSLGGIGFLLNDGTSLPSCPGNVSLSKIVEGFAARTQPFECGQPFGITLLASASCNETAENINDALEAFAEGSFIDCRLTTPTTTETSTVTSTGTTSPTSTATTTVTSTGTTTATTTLTTTPLFSKMVCQETAGALSQTFLGSVAGEECEGQVRLLNNLMESCTGETATFACFGDFVVDGPGCGDVQPAGPFSGHDDLNAMITEYTRGTLSGDVAICSFLGFIQIGDNLTDCSGKVGQINAAMDSFLDGTFADCQLTTPTTTVTSTGTTTVTSSATTTQTSTATSTVTTTGTTSATTTITSTVTSSQTTTATTSPTTTATSTVTTSATTSQTTTQTSTDTTTGTTTVTTTVTTTATSSQTTTVTTSQTTTATSTVTTSVTTSQTTTQTSTVTTSQTTTVTSSQTTTVTSSQTTTVTSSQTTTVTSSQTTTATSSQTTTGTSSATSTVTTTQTTSGTTSQTTTGTTTMTSTPTTTITSTGTTTETSTPTTTATSSATTTVTSTGTSTGTSTVTSTITSTGTTTVTSTVTSTGTTTATSSQTTSATSSGTTTVTSTATTTATSTATTTATSTPTSTATSTETSTVTTTATSTVTTTVTSTATSTQTTTPFLGRLTCHNISGVTYVGIPQDVDCAGYVAVLNDLGEACDDQPLNLTCVELQGITVVVDDTSSATRCRSSAGILNDMVHKYTRTTEVGSLICDLDGFLVDVGCSSIDTLNDVIDSFLDGTFAECFLTTMTSTVTTTVTSSQTTSLTTSLTSTVTTTATTSVTTTDTSTVTSTPTTSMTTTPSHGKLNCQIVDGEEFFTIEPRACEQQTDLLNELMSACGQDITFTCVETFNNTFFRYNNDTRCDSGADIAGAFGHIMSTYRRSSIAGNMTCVLGGLFSIPLGQCDFQASLINDAIDSMLDGTFEDCVLTTPTTTGTTTLTTSVTTTQTSTQTSSPTTTDTTTQTSSVTTTGTSTATSTMTTTPEHAQFGCFTLNPGGVVYLGVPKSTSCTAQVSDLNAVLRICNGTALNDIECGVGDTEFTNLVTQPSVCANVVAELSDIVTEYAMGTLTTQMSCTLGGSIKFDGLCLETVDVLNQAVNAFNEGSFAGCQRTTPTTSATTTATSTLTTSATSTATTSLTTSLTTTATSTRTSTATTSGTTTATTTEFASRIVCLQQPDGRQYLGIGADVCSLFGGLLEDLTKACNPSSGDISCSAAFGDVSPLTDDSLTCFSTASTLEQLILDYSAGDVNASIVCTPGGFLRVIDNCNGTTSVLNDAVASFHDGSFEDCRFTTPTTTATSTVTSSQTTTVTSSQTTSGTSSATSTATTSPSTTVTTSVTTSATTSVTSSQTTSPTTTATSTVTTTGTSTVTSSVTTTVTSTGTTSATTSGTSTVTSSGTTSATSSQTTTQTSSQTTSATSSQTTTQTSSQTTTQTSSQTTSATSTVTTSATTTVTSSGTTSMTSSVTTSETSTGTSTATSSQTTSATSTVTTSATTSQTSSQTTTQTSTATTTETSTATTTVTTSKTSTETTSYSTTATTTPTTTTTTSVTTTATSTATSSLTTSPTSTVTTTLTSSGTTTATSTLTTTVTSTKTTTATTTLTTSLTTSKTTTQTSSVTSTLTSTPTTTQTSSVTTSLTTSATTTATSSGTTTATFTGTTTGTSTVTSSATTTLTSSRTTSQTSTQTTTQTTTFLKGVFSCFNFNGEFFLHVDEAENCTFQTETLNAMISTCPGVVPTQFECDESGSFLKIVSDGFPSSSSCTSAVAALNIAVRESAFRPTTFTCSSQGAVRNDDNCVSDVEALNDAVSGFIDGSFSNCDRTTATTTPTTTATTTPVSSKLGLLFENLDCTFLNFSSQRAEFHNQIKAAVNEACAHVGGNCQSEDIVSACGSVVSEVSVKVGGLPSNYTTVDDVVAEAITDGRVTVTVLGTEHTPRSFPLPRQLRLDYNLALDTVAPTAADKTQLQSDITNLLQLKLDISSIDILNTTLVVTDEGFAYIMTLTVDTTTEYFALRDADVVLQNQIDSSQIDIAFNGFNLSPVSSATESNDEDNASSADDDSALNRSEVVVVIVVGAVLVILIFVILYCYCMRSRRRPKGSAPPPRYRANSFRSHTGLENATYTQDHASAQDPNAIADLMRGYDGPRWSDEPSSDWVVWAPMSNRISSISEGEEARGDSQGNKRSVSFKDADTSGMGGKSPNVLGSPLKSALKSASVRSSGNTGNAELTENPLFHAKHKDHVEYLNRDEFESAANELSLLARQAQSADDPEYIGIADDTPVERRRSSSAVKLVNELFQPQSELAKQPKFAVTSAANKWMSASKKSSTKGSKSKPSEPVNVGYGITRNPDYDSEDDE